MGNIGMGELIVIAVIALLVFGAGKLPEVGSQIGKSINEFKKLGLNEAILNSIREHKFEKPTEIQEKTIPLVLAGKDVIAGASTGSGKTLAFGSGIVQNLKKEFTEIDLYGIDSMFTNTVKSFTNTLVHDKNPDSEHQRIVNWRKNWDKLQNDYPNVIFNFIEE